MICVIFVVRSISICDFFFPSFGSLLIYSVVLVHLVVFVCFLVALILDHGIRSSELECMKWSIVFAYFYNWTVGMHREYGSVSMLFHLLHLMAVTRIAKQMACVFNFVRISNVSNKFSLDKHSLILSEEELCEKWRNSINPPVAPPNITITILIVLHRFLKAIHIKRNSSEATAAYFFFFCWNSTRRNEIWLI